MKIVHFNLETITPLFMAGADNKTPELRAPSFKGMIRYWWRAMYPKTNIASLQEEEAKLFGGTEKGYGKSKFLIRINRDDALDKKKYSPLPHKENSHFTLPAIAPGQEFKVILKLNGQHQKLMLASFKLAILLGGFGKRSRRGFGALSHHKYKNIDEIIDEVKELTALFDHEINYVNNKNRVVFSRKVDINMTEYPRVCEILIGKRGENSFQALLKKIGCASHKHSDNALGTIRPTRFSSPVIASIVKADDMFFPLVTKLTSHATDNIKKNHYYNVKKQDDFINEVLK